MFSSYNFQAAAQASNVRYKSIEITTRRTSLREQLAGVIDIFKVDIATLLFYFLYNVVRPVVLRVGPAIVRSYDGLA